MKAILIDPAGETLVSEVEVGRDYREIYKQLGCECFTTVGLGPRDVMYVDDEGLLNGSFQRIGGFQLKGYPQPLAGRGLILGFRPDGESASTSFTAETAEPLFKRL